jgi:hypothetical protein
VADVTSAVNDNARDLDPVVTSAAYVGLKRGRRRVTATALTPDTVAQAVVPDASSTGTLSNVSASASSVTVLAANTDRLIAIVVNDSSAIAYIKFASAASITSYTYKLEPGDTLEVPESYTGIITGIWSSATGTARVTEVA